MWYQERFFDENLQNLNKTLQSKTRISKKRESITLKRTKSVEKTFPIWKGLRFYKNKAIR